jgi:ribosomal protein S27E
LREERRRTLGDWVALCPSCGHARRYFDWGEGEVVGSCPTCGTRLVSRCAACGDRISSMFAVECEGCGNLLREPAGFGAGIRRKPR